MLFLSTFLDFQFLKKTIKIWVLAPSILCEAAVQDIGKECRFSSILFRFCPPNPHLLYDLVQVA